MRHVGVKHLFVVPRIRSSAYIQLLADLYPSIRSANPGEIQEEALPDLRNIVVVDNEESCRAELDALGVKSLIDWREVFVWRQDRSSLDQQRQAAADSLHKDEVINLQFTRSLFCLRTLLPLLISIFQWHDGVSKGRVANPSQSVEQRSFSRQVHAFDRPGSRL